MANRCLAVLETVQIQSYVFASNRLRENVGASHLVALAARDWVYEAAAAAGVSNIKAGELDLSAELGVLGGCTVEVIYTGGGNAAIAFQGNSEMERFIRAYSKFLLSRAPGLQVAFASVEWSPGNQLRKTISEAMQKLADAKMARSLDASLLGLSVTKACGSTGLPAVATTPVPQEGERPISAEILAKLRVTERVSGLSEADSRLINMLKLPSGFAFPSELDELGRTEGESSYIAVIHADGDGLGQRKAQLGEGQQGADDKAYKEILRRFSSGLQQAVEQALKDTLDQLLSRIDAGTISHAVVGPDGQKHTIGQIVLRSCDRSPAKWWFPVRPLIVAGDDVTVVSDGRLGLSFTVHYLDAFARRTAELLPGGAGTASAGVAIVKSHYPFARSYEFAEELASSAKRFRRDENLASGCLDWHFASSGPVQTPEVLRKREYMTPAGNLEQRPVCLGTFPAKPLRTWGVVENAVHTFQEKWSGQRNKAKSLREVLRKGPSEVERFRMAYLNGQELPALGVPSTTLTKEGWESGRCGYFDALELMDLYFPLS
jgi:hypothetical protein